MEKVVLADAGPLVAILNSKEAHHEWAAAQLTTQRHPMWTCDAVLSEAFFLLKRHTHNGCAGLSGMLKRGVLISRFDFTAVQGRVMALMEKYRDLPVSFADACLVAMAESIEGSRVWTLDQDFKLYRKRDRRTIPLIAPP